MSSAKFSTFNNKRAGISMLKQMGNNYTSQQQHSPEREITNEQKTEIQEAVRHISLDHRNWYGYSNNASYSLIFLIWILMEVLIIMN